MGKGKDYLFYVNYLERTVHILEMENNPTNRLTNKIDPSWQHRFIDENLLLQDVYEFDWYIYGADGLVMKYRNYNFTFVNDYSKLYQEFITILGKARNIH